MRLFFEGIDSFSAPGGPAIRRVFENDPCFIEFGANAIRFRIVFLFSREQAGGDLFANPLIRQRRPGTALQVLIGVTLQDPKNTT